MSKRDSNSPPPRGPALTFRLLAESRNTAADEVLYRVLDEPDTRIRQAAAEVVLRRRRPGGEARVIEKLHTFDQPWVDGIEPHFVHMDHAIRACLLGSSREGRRNAAQAILRGLGFHLSPLLVNCLLEGRGDVQRLAGETLGALTHRYTEICRDPSRLPAWRKAHDLPADKQHLYASLDRALKHYRRHRQAEVIEWLLELTGGRAAEVIRTVVDPRHPAHEDALGVLRTSRHPDVAAWVLGMLQMRKSPATALLQVLLRRTDLPFVEQLCDSIGALADPKLQSRLRRLKQVLWLRVDHETFGKLTDPQRAGAVVFMMQTGMSTPAKMDVLTFLLSEGEVAARRAAAGALVQVSGLDATRLLIRCLRDPLEPIQLLAAKAIIQRGIPKLESYLAPLLDSPFESVREAAREGLGHHDFQKYLKAYDQLTPDNRAKAGQLMAKIDPRSSDRLKAEMHSEDSKRRMRAVKIAKMLEMSPQLETELIDLTRDSSSMIRSYAVSALEGVVSHEAAQALGAAMSDTDARVRANAVSALVGYRDPRLLGVFRLMGHDPHQRVRANAFAALVRMDDPSGIEGLDRMSREPAERYRLSAAWALGQLDDAGARAILSRLAKSDPSDRVRAMAARWLVAGAVGSTATPQRARAQGVAR